MSSVARALVAASVLLAQAGAASAFPDEDGSGQPVRRGVLIAIDPDPASLRLAASAGFRPLNSEPDPGLGFTIVYLSIPTGLSAARALQRLRRAAPAIEADVDHIYKPADAPLRRSSPGSEPVILTLVRTCYMVC